MFDLQIPPTARTEEKKDDDEGAIPPYDQETQNLIDGKNAFKTEWLILSWAISIWLITDVEACQFAF